jgi:hypothetical protein
MSDERFVVVKDGILHTLMISDYQYWVDNEAEIEEWMDKTLPQGREHRRGMMIQFDSTQTMMMFMLRWA